MHYVLLSMLAGALFGGGMAIAQTADKATQPRHLSSFEERFKAADKDGDGALTKSEAESARLGRIVDHFERLDTNGDGKLTRDEIRALIRSRVSS